MGLMLPLVRSCLVTTGEMRAQKRLFNALSFNVKLRLSE